MMMNMAIGSKITLGLVLCTVLGAALGYSLTWVIPPPDRTPSTPMSIVQTRFLSVSSLAMKSDADLTKTGVPDTNLSITTGGNSYLVAEFSGHVWIFLDVGFQNQMDFNITMAIDGTDVAWTLIDRFYMSAISNAEQTSEAIHFSFISGILPAGTHVANITWASRFSCAGSDSISMSTAGMNMTRSIMLQEIHA